MLRLFILIPIFLLAVPSAPRRAPASPYLSGDSFRSYCDYCYDEVDSSLNPHQVLARSTIFVKTDFLEDFFQKIHPFLPPYVLISHNSDDPFPGKFHIHLNEAHLLGWFGQNYDGYPHEKLHPIPIGIANSCWEHGNAGLLKRQSLFPVQKNILAHMSFATQTFPQERIEVHRRFFHVPFCHRTLKRPFRFYLEDLAHAHFSFAPRGNGLDTHRIWESLYVHTIPVVKSSSLDFLYKDLPILIVKDWSEVSEDFLLQKQEEFSRMHFSLEKLWMPYWIACIEHVKKSGL